MATLHVGFRRNSGWEAGAVRAAEPPRARESRREDIGTELDSVLVAPRPPAFRPGRREPRDHVRGMAGVGARFREVLRDGPDELQVGERDRPHDHEEDGHQEDEPEELAEEEGRLVDRLRDERVDAALLEIPREREAREENRAEGTEDRDGADRPDFHEAQAARGIDGGEEGRRTDDRGADDEDDEEDLAADGLEKREGRDGPEPPERRPHP